VGDIILKVSGNEVETLDELADFCSEMTAGRETKITVLRGLEKLDLVIVPEFCQDK
jgi:S1-C subfamily serine protease